MIRVRPDELPVGPYSPFDHDQLDRERRVSALCQLIPKIESAAVVAVNGHYGSGKSVFLRMCASQLRVAGVEVVEFNAWTQSHTGLPLVDLVSSLSNEKAIAPLRDIAINIGLRAMSILSRGFFAREDFAKADAPPEFSAWHATEARINEFNEELTKLMKHDRLVVFIDELDRCLPEQAIEYLNAVRHLFDVPKVVIVLGINERELRHRVKKLFGQDCNAEMYLRRFVDLMVDLPDPGPSLENYMEWVYAAAGLEDRLKAGEGQHSGRMVRLLAERSGMSLRDIEQTVHRVACVLAALPEPDPSSDKTLDYQSALEEATLSLYALRTVAPDAYAKFVASEDDRFVAAARLVHELSLGSVTGDPEAEAHATAIRMAAVLLTVEPTHESDPMSAQDLQGRLAKIGLDDTALTEAIEREVQAVRPYFRLITVRELANIVELAV